MTRKKVIQSQGNYNENWTKNHPPGLLEQSMERPNNLWKFKVSAKHILRAIDSTIQSQGKVILDFYVKPILANCESLMPIIILCEIDIGKYT